MDRLVTKCPSCFWDLEVSVDESNGLPVEALGECKCGALPTFQIKVSYEVGELLCDRRWLGLEEFRVGLPDGYNREVYRFFTSAWDIVKVRFLIENRGEELYSLPYSSEGSSVESLAESFGLDEPQDGVSVPLFTRHVDHAWAVGDKNNPALPIVFGLHRFEEEDEKPSLLLLDGGHRLYRANRDRVGLTYYLLSEEETGWCQVR